MSLVLTISTTAVAYTHAALEMIAGGECALKGAFAIVILLVVSDGGTIIYKMLR
jgi:hypothetical protein